MISTGLDIYMHFSGGFKRSKHTYKSKIALILTHSSHCERRSIIENFKNLWNNKSFFIFIRNQIKSDIFTT